MNAPHLRRDLGFIASLSVVVGTVIGTGIFLKAAVMAQLLGSAVWLLVAWVAAGALSIAGAATYAELAAMLPHSGGSYVYLRSAYGKAPAFLFGWKEFLSTKGASNAAVSVAIAIFLSQLLPFHAVWFARPIHVMGEVFRWQFGSQQIEAIAIIAVLSAVNCLGVRAGGRLQTLLTVLKLVGIAFLVFGAFALSRAGSWTHLLSQGTHHSGPPSLAAFGAAMIAALWAYSGWGDLTEAAGEVRRPGTNLPRGLIIGVLVVIGIYVLTNIAYIYALPMPQIAGANSTAHPSASPVAALVASALLGPVGAAFLSLLFVLSALGTLNGGILSGARVPFAMARDGQFPHALAKVDARSHAPVVSILVLGVWASVLTLSGTFDQLTTLVILLDIVLDFFSASTIFVLRRRMPGLPRPFATPGYPLTPAIYMLALAWLIFEALKTSPVELLGAIAILVIGLPVYWYYRSRGTATHLNATGEPS